MKKKLIYTTSVSIDGATGQNVFESQMIYGLLSDSGPQKDIDLALVSAAEGETFSDDDRLTLIPIKRSSYLGFIRFQFKMFMWLSKELRHTPPDYHISVFVRYHPSMIAPYLASLRYNFRMVIRTGPILPNLSIYKKDPGWFFYRMIHLFTGLHYKKADAIVTVTDKIKDWVVKAYPINPGKVHIVPNGVDLECFFPELAQREEFDLPEDEVIAGFVGNIYEDQGLQTILDAMAILIRSERMCPFLVVVGDGTELERLKKESVDLGIDHKVRWLGRVEHSRVRSIINSTNFCIAPFTKRAFEITGSSALKLFEYLACDKPVIASLGAGHEFVSDNEIGELIPPEDPAAWADALSAFTKNPVPLAGRGHAYVVAKRSVNSMISSILRICHPQ